MPQTIISCDIDTIGGATSAYLLVAQRLRKFPETDNMRKVDGLSFLSQCRRCVCDVAVRHIYIVAAGRKVEGLCHSEHRRRGKCEPSLAPATQRRDTVYWKRGITYLRDLERRKTYALSCPGLRL